MLGLLCVIGCLAQQIEGGDAGPPASANVPTMTTADMPAERAAESTSPPLVLEQVEFLQRVYFKEETLRSRLRSAVGAPLDADMLRADAESFTNDYRARGYLHGSVSYVLRAGKDPQHRVASFVIDAGPQAELRSVQIVGNERVSDDVLREGLFSRPPEVFGAVTRAGVFHRPYIDQDAQRITANYYKQGFLEARVTDIRVSARPMMDALDVVFTVSEGAQYELSGIDVVNDDGSKAPFVRERIGVRDGDVCDLVRIQTEADSLVDDLREVGHALARVEMQVAPDNAPGTNGRKRLRIVIKRTAGPVATVRHVRIQGQHQTSEHVWLRDIVLQEGERYQHSLLKRSEAQLMQTGLLVSAVGKAVPVPATELAPPAPGQAFVDVEMTIQQTPVTWVVSPAGFVDPNEGLVFVGLLGDRNLLGTGLSTFFSLQWSALRLLFDLSITEPRLFDSRVAVSAEIHRRSYVYRDFKIESDLGGSVRASQSWPLGFDLGGPAFISCSGGVGVERTGVNYGDAVGLPASLLLPQHAWRNTVDVGGSFDTRSGGLAAKNGVLFSISGSSAGPFTLSNVGFIDVATNLRLYWTPLWDITLRSSSTLGLVTNPFGEDVPVTDRFFLGGAGSVRGYFPRTIAPERLLAGQRILVGGTSRVQQSFEVDVPTWPQAPLRLFGFVDVGNAFDGLPSADALQLFTSVGGGVRIDNGAFPLRFEWSLPLQKRSYDQTVNFFVGVGSSI
jgi:outer membrane protein insertion porin family